MDPIPKSEYNYANKIALLSLKALEEVMGKNGLNAILNLAHLPHIIDHYPPDNLEREFNFADFSALNLALEEMYGPRGGRGLALRAGRAAFADALRHFGALAGASDLAFRVLPLQMKMRIGILGPKAHGLLQGSWSNYFRLMTCTAVALNDATALSPS